jgi:elongation factor Ts
MAITASMVKELRDRTGLGMMECKKALNESDGNIETAIEELRKSSGMKAAKKAGRTAAEGVVAIKISDDKKVGVLLEVNSETDFVARDDNFLSFVQDVLNFIFINNDCDESLFKADVIETKREALVQKIGENISIRRAQIINGENIGGYVHGNNKIAALVSLSSGSELIAKDIAMHVAAINPQVVKPEDMSSEIIEKEKAIYIAQAKDSGKPDEIIKKMVDGRVRKFLSENSLTEQQFVKDPDVKVSKLLSKESATINSFFRYEVGEGIEKDDVDFAAEVAAQVKQST